MNFSDWWLRLRLGNLISSIYFILDIDECQRGSNDCDNNASCTNTQGGFTCACKDGYSGNGKSCTGMDYDFVRFALLLQNHFKLVKDQMMR